MVSIPKKIFSALIFAIVLLAIAIFLSAPDRYAKSISDGITLWAVSVLPATFPFLFLTALLTALPPFSAFARKVSPIAGKLFRVSGAGAGAAILASVSGYPVGARLFFDLKSAGRIQKSETFRLSCLVTTSGPPFLVGTVGAMMFGSAKAGWILLFSHLIAVWTVCFFLRFKSKPLPKTSLPPLKQNPDLLYDSLFHAVISVLCVGGFIALFYCFGDMLEGVGFFRLLGGNQLTEGVVRGLLEMTTGCAVLSKSPSPLTLALCCSLVTFGGLCVLCQQLAYLMRAGVRPLPFLGVKLLQAILAFMLCFLLASI